MSIESIIEDIQVLEDQLDAISNEGSQGDGPDEILYAALKALRFSRSMLERMEVYDGPMKMNWRDRPIIANARGTCGHEVLALRLHWRQVPFLPVLQAENAMTTEILDANLPLITAMRAAVERGQILQIDGNHAVLCDRLLPGYVAIVGGGEKERGGAE